MSEEKKNLIKIQKAFIKKFEDYIVSKEVAAFLITNNGISNDLLLDQLLHKFKTYSNKEIIKLRENHKAKLIEKINNGEYDDGMSEIIHIRSIIYNLLDQRSKSFSTTKKV